MNPLQVTLEVWKVGQPLTEDLDEVDLLLKTKEIRNIA